MILETEIWSTR